MTTPHIALLRGINVGRAKRVGMAELRITAESLGWAQVRTLLNSGNLVFAAPPADDHARRLEAALAAQLDLKSRVTVLTAEALDAVMADNPFHEQAAVGPSRMLTTLLRRPEVMDRLSPLPAA